MTHEQIFEKVRGVLVDALAVDEEEVTPEATLTGDLGAESIDFLDIGFKLEQAFGFKIAQGELFPENVQQDPQFVQDGKVTPKGIAALKQRLPHADFSRLEKDPQVSKVGEIFTVEALVRFVERKLGGATAAPGAKA
jgi:acyl carrier protein